MIAYIKKYKLQIALFLFLMIPVIAIDTSTRSSRDYHFYDRAIIGITSPIQAGIQMTLDWLVNTYQNYLYLKNTRQTNVALLDENRKLLSTITELHEIERENYRLRELLNFREKQKLKTILARVIAKDISTEFRAVRINRGESAGLKRDMPIVTAEGIVGRVLRTTQNTADIITILDPLSAVDGIIARNRVRGVVEGLSEDHCEFRFVLRTDDIQVGDLIVSSGLGGIFPKGVPLGTVSQVRKKNYGISQDVEIRPSVDFARLEEVLIITEMERSTIDDTLPLPSSSPVKKEKTN